MDDELMGLLMDPAEGAGPAARPAGAAAIGGAAAAAAAADDEDDGLMELIDEEEEEQPAGQQAQQAPQQGEREQGAFSAWHVMARWGASAAADADAQPQLQCHRNAGLTALCTQALSP